MTYILLGLIAATIVVLLDQRSVKGGLILSEIAGVIGALMGWEFSVLVFGRQYYEPNLSSLMLVFTVSMLIVILVRVSFRESFMSNTPSSRNSNYLYVTHHQITRPVNASKEARDFIKTVAFPVSKRDLVHFAEVNDIDSETLSLFESLPDHIYRNAKDLQVQINKTHKELIVP